jgi:hypothetical protein
MPSQQPKTRQSSLPNNLVLKTAMVIMAVLVVVSVAATVYFWRKSVAEISPRADAQTETSDETQALLAEVGRLILLPEDEVPTVATVTDPSALQDQEFFRNAKKGDKVIIYSRARKAILYDSVAKKIIEVAPITVGNEPQL